MNPKQTLIVLAGCPFTGKTTIADELRLRLGCPSVSVDRLRPILFGKVARHDTDPQGDVYQLSRAYPAMRSIADAMLSLGDSVILDATFSSKQRGQDAIIRYLADRHGAARCKIVLCVIAPDDPEKERKVVEERANARSLAYPSGAMHAEDYYRVKVRFEKMEFPHLVVDTTRGYENCLEEILNFITTD